ncbi:redoxin domain-containing protein [Kordiimonas sp. SCSIO 12610]|uniref:redoxin domain-containing protein n=1 Tax=Kordiimonas sp. SCSIO 12610 TaxID=2829597 RepID=UPI002109C5B0|nr:redoxin domain-containing protein [Kordiimonas sp. SCSIO 12610]UTW54803.1 redoxin domain-containing protein [Kordiimonas sp. SCSIO 12610]
MKHLSSLLVALCLTACGTEVDTNQSTESEAKISLHTAASEVTSEDLYVDNFQLLDHEGRAHELYYYDDAPAIVIMIQGNGCPIVRNAWSDYRDIRDEYQDQGIQFYMLNANKQDNRERIGLEAANYSYDIPILKDDTQLIAESLNVTRTAEVLVISPSDWSILYRGPVNDRLSYGQQRKEAKNHYLKEAIDAAIAGEAVEVPVRKSKGCIVNLPETKKRPEHAKISYSETIAPMLEKNCAECHQDGGIGPWAMTGYDMVEGFAPMIREVVRTQRMPPWSADPHVGKFNNGRGLSIEEKRTLVHWIEAGAPRGDGPDPLADRVSDATVWPLGEPDLIIEAPAFDVPASGIIDYQFPTAPNPLDRDVWVKAVTVVPGDKTVVHHALVGSSETVTPAGQGDGDDVFENYLIGFVPGAESYVYPENTGVEVKAGGEFRFQMHYTTSGKATTDKTKLGLYFHDKEPEHRLRQQVAINFRINIPANSDNHQEQAYFEFDHDATLYMLFPHAHYRGKSSEFAVQYPDGKEETILSVPKYDFNWQHSYNLEKPLDVPAGARLIHRTRYDNSKRNLANPDPDSNIRWGLQSAEEMLYGSFFFRWTDESKTNPLHDPLQFNLRQFFGFADRNMDGKLSRDELSGNLAQAWDSGRLKQVDRDNDNALSFAEFYAMQKARRQAQGR